MDHALREASALRAALDEHSLLSITDARGRIIDVNTGFCRISGYSREELLGQDHRILNSGHHPKSFWVDAWKQIATGRAWRGEVCNRAKDGRHYWVDSTIVPTLDSDGKVEQYVSIRFDITAQKEAQRDIYALKSALDEHALLSIADRSGKIIEVNTGFCRISGYTREELLGQDHRILNSGHHPKSFWIDAWKQIAAGRAWRGEVCNKRKDGSHYWVDSTIVPYLGPDGRVDKYVSIRFDITSVKQSREEIDALAARFAIATEGVGVGVWDLDLATEKVVWDQAMHHIYGTDDSMTEPSVSMWWDLVHPDDTQIAHEFFEDARRGENNVEATFRIRTPWDETRHVQAVATPVRDEAGRPVRVVGINWDVTQQKTAEARLELAMRASNIGLWDWDVAGGKTFYSDTFYEMLGYEPGELPMSIETWRELCDPDDFERAMADVQAHFRGETPHYENEQRMRRKDGTWTWIRDVGEIVERDDRGAPSRMIGVHVDVDAQHKATADLEAARQSAEDANRSKSEFLANMSHEIRTPMTAILGYADLLAEDEIASDPERLRDSVQTIRGNAQHLLTIINDILDMSKIEAGKMTVEQIETDPAAVVREVESLMQTRTTAKGIGLVVRFDGPIPQRVQTDPTRLRQVLLNLVGNAIKFTTEGSVTIEVSCDAAEERMSFAVIDTGVGMTPAQLDTVRKFDAFNQADTSTTRKFGGTGLGLRISHALTRRLGGQLAVDSQAGAGSRFTATIATGSLAGVTLGDPTEVDETASAAKQASGSTKSEPPAEPDELPLAGVRVLVVEDGIDNQRLIGYHLRKVGAEVETADHGRLALERLTQGEGSEGALLVPLPFDVILTDMQMPEMDGYELADRLRTLTCPVPVVALTAHAMESDRDKCLSAGCVDYITKPIDRDRLIEVCVAWSKRDQPSARAA